MSLCGSLQGQVAHLSAGVSNGRPGVLHRNAAAGHAFIGTFQGGCADHANLIECNIEFVSGDDGQSRQDALPQFDFAGEDSHQTWTGKIQPLREQAVDVQVAGQDGATVVAVDREGPRCGGTHGQVVCGQ